jgi:O-acetyl-ADP-ribose deacetylase (regulator of RNase III)
MLFPAAVIDGLVHQLGGKYLQIQCSSIPEQVFSHAYHNQQSAPEDWSATGTTVKNNDREHVKCPVGTAVVTSAGGEQLRAEYDNIVHTVPPFYKYPPTATPEMKQLLGVDAESLDQESWSHELLRSCYRHSFRLAFGCGQRNVDRNWGTLRNLLEAIGIRKHSSLSENQRVAVPLLGAGCRGFPAAVAIEAAVAESVLWLNNESFHEDNMLTPQSPRDTEPVVAFGLIETSDAEALATKLSEALQMHVSNLD